jgi:cobalt/nickel transport system permease protein
MPRSDGRRGRRVLLAWLVAIFALSAVTSLAALVALLAVAALVFRRGLGRSARRVLVAVVPLAAVLAGASFAWLALLSGARPDPAPFVALVLRTALIAFVTFSVLARVDLFRALAPFPTLTRLLVVTLAQVHALRLLLTESLLGLRSRLLRRPSTRDALRGAGGITGTLFTLTQRNARDVADALKSRGF